MSRHPSDPDLLAAASPARRPDAWTKFHLSRCRPCQRRQAELSTMMAAMRDPEAGVESVPSWDRVRPRLGRGQTLRMPWARAIAIAVGVLIFFGWPQAIWGQGPSGPAALEVMAMGRPAALRRVQATAGVVTIKWSPTTGWALLRGHQMPACPPGEVYEAWWIRGGRHIEAGTFRPDASGRTTLWIQSSQDFKGVTALGITLEPWPGTRQPTGSRQYFGSLASSP